MALLDNAKVVRVVAFDAQGHPIHKNDNWNVAFRAPQMVRLTCGSYSRDYDLTADVQCFYTISEENEVALGKTLGRLALTGVASSIFKKGTWLGGALMDLSVRGVAHRTSYSTLIAFKDLTIIHAILPQEHYQMLEAFVPGSATSTLALKEVDELVDLVDRMIEDGAALSELVTTIRDEDARIVDTKLVAETGKSFQERDGARRRMQEVEAGLHRKVRLALAVAHGLGQPMPFIGAIPAGPAGLLVRELVAKPRRASILVALVCTTIAFVLLLILVRTIEMEITGADTKQTGEFEKNVLFFLPIVIAAIGAAFVWRTWRPSLVKEDHVAADKLKGNELPRQVDTMEEPPEQQRKLAWSSNVLLHPWVGDKYWDAPWGGRLLILGESQYGESSQPTSSTQTLIRECADGTWTPKIYPIVQKLITGSDVEGAERNRFWQSVAYYNFIQEVVGDSAGIRPTPEMWEGALAPFQEVLSNLRPHLLLVLGLGTWQHLDDWPYIEPVVVKNLKLEVCTFNVGKHRGVATAVPHPTGSRGFDWIGYHEALSAFLIRHGATRTSLK